MFIDRLKEHLSNLQQAVIKINTDLTEKYEQDEEARSAEISKLQTECQRLQARILELESKKCASCKILQQKLTEEQRLNRSAREQLKSIVSLLNTDEGQKNTLTNNAQWTRMTQILEDERIIDCGKKRKFTSLIADDEERLLAEKKFNSKIIAPETMKICETQQQPRIGIVVPETQDLVDLNDNQNNKKGEVNYEANLVRNLLPQNNSFLESVEEKVERIRAERMAESGVEKQIWMNKSTIPSAQNESEKHKLTAEKAEIVCDKIKNNQKEAYTGQARDSPSVSLTNKELQDGKNSVPFKKQIFINCDTAVTVDRNVKNDSLRNCSQRQSSETVKKQSFWKLKPSVLINSVDGGKGDGKRNLKQTKLSLGVVQKKQDITTLGTFNGGVANSYKEEEDDDSDVVFDSPKSKGKKTKFSSRRKMTIGTKDLDKTLFQPPATSTCLPETENHNRSEMAIGTKDLDETLLQPPAASTCLPETENHNRVELTLQLGTDDLDETSFQPLAVSTCKTSLVVDNSYDRLPEPPESPPYKYKRAAVRKRAERIRLPGWSCDECAKYYEVAGQDWSKEEIQQRMNACSRHRDKYQLRAKTPPGFWNPVIPP